MPKYIVSLLDTKPKPSRIVKEEIIEAKTSSKAMDKFIMKIHKQYDLTEMRTEKYARYVVMGSKAIEE
jgi:hypothetical protein